MRRAVYPGSFDLEFCHIPAGILVDLSREVTKLDIVGGLVCMHVYREVYFQQMLAELPVHIGLEIDSSVLAVEMNLLTDHGAHELSLYLKRCPYRALLQPLHGAHIFHAPGFFLMENIGRRLAYRCGDCRTSVWQDYRRGHCHSKPGICEGGRDGRGTPFR